VRRVVDDVGIESIVFGSDFPHGEGLAYPERWAESQLAGFGADEVRRIMRDTLAGFLDDASR
jgi:predicted TIM-barrel fold metal-dependent hydrolase